MAECDYIKQKFSGWTDEKRKIVLIALGGAISCRACRTVHYFKEETTNEGN